MCRKFPYLLRDNLMPNRNSEHKPVGQDQVYAFQWQDSREWPLNLKGEKLRHRAKPRWLKRQTL